MLTSRTTKGTDVHPRRRTARALAAFAATLTAVGALAIASVPETVARGAERLPATGQLSPNTRWQLSNTKPSDGEQWCLRYSERDGSTGTGGAHRFCQPAQLSGRGTGQFVLDCARGGDLAVFGGGRAVASVTLQRERQRYLGRVYRGAGTEADSRFFVVHVHEHDRPLQFRARDASGRMAGRSLRIPGRAQLCATDEQRGTTAFFSFSF